MSTFTTANDETLVELIRAAKQRLVFVAPGVRSKVATALCDAMKPGRLQHLHIVLDVDSEVCRLGFGDLKAIETLQKAASESEHTVNTQPGVRLGILISDQKTLIYSPTPELIEAQSRHSEKPNAILLEAGAPAELANACGVGTEGAASLEVGGDPVNAATVEAVKKDLERFPPKPFNVARIERVFNSMLHYVELTVEKYNLGNSRIQLDTGIFDLKDPNLQRHLVGGLVLFPEPADLEVPIPEVDEGGSPLRDKPKHVFGPSHIQKARTQIERNFIIKTPGFGNLILRRDVQKFESEVRRLHASIEIYCAEMRRVVNARITQLGKHLSTPAKNRFRKNLPTKWQTRFLGDQPTDADIERLFAEDLMAEGATILKKLQTKVTFLYKDVTYHTFKDAKFRALLEKRFGREAINRIFEEHDAAPEA